MGGLAPTVEHIADDTDAMRQTKVVREGWSRLCLLADRYRHLAAAQLACRRSGINAAGIRHGTPEHIRAGDYQALPPARQLIALVTEPEPLDSEGHAAA